jgi:hypothetical protein
MITYQTQGGPKAEPSLIAEVIELSVCIIFGLLGEVVSPA